MKRWYLALLLVVAAGVAPALQAQDETGRRPDTLGWHVVREGETFETITERYLGTPDLWRDNFVLNPGLTDPHRIYPGQRLRVILDREVPARQALIEKVANEVDKNLQQSGWKSAASGDVLAPRDGVRTRARSSADLGFDDGSHLTLSEYSQVFLKGMETSLTGVRRGTIEVERGQAELHLRALKPELSDVELVIGATVARPRPGPSGLAETRARRPEAGGSQLMVYGGSSAVEAGGVALEVATGMGTTVPEDGPPAPPEKLLPPPSPLAPAAGASLAYANPRFTWQAVAGAVAYVVEVCRDPGCGQLVERATGLPGESWQPEALPLAALFWRVTAVSPSGLDGYPSGAVAFSVLSTRRDLEPPVVVAMARGEAAFDPADGGLVLGPGGSLELAAHDDVAGVATVRYRWNGGEWQTWQGAAEAVTPPAGDLSEHRLELQAGDVLEQESPVYRVSVRRDLAAPASPRVERGLR